ncbi:MAG: aminopeptidase P family protein [Desulfobulbaceae bacterium]|jgi:Xaa-Pro aminopeptidase|nr:aminopeptidase P family protein [Desulfobulbaceae bacterium]
MMVIDYQRRLAAVSDELGRLGLDALLVANPYNRRYLSGFTAGDHGIEESSGLLLATRRGQAMLLTDFRYRQQAETDAPWLEVKVYEHGLTAMLEDLLPALAARNLAIEADYTLLSQYQEMGKKLDEKGVHLHPTEGLVGKYRQCKDEAELELIRRSVALNERVFQDIFAGIAPGQSERDIALALETRMRQLGAEGASFPTIVACGASAALPHAVPGAALVEASQPITIDMGLILDGYCSDMTRSFVHGQADARYQEIHRLVRRAQLAGIAALKAGMTGKEVDAAARQVIADAGYGASFGHSLGHGVGLQVHEAPRLSSRAETPLQDGMVVTVEPGIYLPGWGGVRLEVMAVVRESGCEVLGTDATWLDI